jgi:hypothetical protein
MISCRKEIALPYDSSPEYHPRVSDSRCFRKLSMPVCLFSTKLDVVPWGTAAASPRAQAKANKTVRILQSWKECELYERTQELKKQTINKRIKELLKLVN